MVKPDDHGHVGRRAEPGRDLPGRETGHAPGHAPGHLPGHAPGHVPGHAPGLACAGGTLAETGRGRRAPALHHAETA